MKGEEKKSITTIEEMIREENIRRYTSKTDEEHEHICNLLEIDFFKSKKSEKNKGEE